MTILNNDNRVTAHFSNHSHARPLRSSAKHSFDRAMVFRKDGIPVFTIYPAQTSKRAEFGVAKDSGQVLGDLVEPPLSPTNWKVLQ